VHAPVQRVNMAEAKPPMEQKTIRPIARRCECLVRTESEMAHTCAAPLRPLRSVPRSVRLGQCRSEQLCRGAQSVIIVLACCSLLLPWSVAPFPAAAFASAWEYGFSVSSIFKRRLCFLCWLCSSSAFWLMQ